MTTEKAFLDKIRREIADPFGWLLYHTFNSRRSEAGFPDLVLVRDGRILFIELKKDDKAKPSPAQILWLAALKECPGVEVYLWRPSDLDLIVETLKPEGRSVRVT